MSRHVSFLKSPQTPTDLGGAQVTTFKNDTCRDMCHFLKSPQTPTGLGGAQVTTFKNDTCRDMCHFQKPLLVRATTTTIAVAVAPCELLGFIRLPVELGVVGVEQRHRTDVTPCLARLGERAQHIFVYVIVF